MSWMRWGQYKNLAETLVAKNLFELNQLYFSIIFLNYKADSPKDQTLHVAPRPKYRLSEEFWLKED